MATPTVAALESGPPGIVARAQYWFACLFVTGWTGVLGGGLVLQLVRWEPPCPLCVVQRMFMVLAMLGAAHIVRQGLSGTVPRRDYLMGWGLALVGCMGGSFAAWPQAALRILPGDQGPGGEVLGLAPSVWSWLLFQASVVAIGLMMITSHLTAARRIPLTGGHCAAGYAALTFAALVVAVSAVAVFLEEGLHAFLPDAPTRYQLLHDIGLLG